MGSEDFLAVLIKCMVSNITVSSTDKDPTQYRAKLDAEELNEAYQKLLLGLVHICPMDSEMNQEKFDTFKNLTE